MPLGFKAPSFTLPSFSGSGLEMKESMQGASEFLRKTTMKGFDLMTGQKNLQREENQQRREIEAERASFFKMFHLDKGGFARTPWKPAFPSGESARSPRSEVGRKGKEEFERGVEEQLRRSKRVGREEGDAFGAAAFLQAQRSHGSAAIRKAAVQLIERRERLYVQMSQRMLAGQRGGLDAEDIIKCSDKILQCLAWLEGESADLSRFAEDLAHRQDMEARVRRRAQLRSPEAVAAQEKKMSALGRDCGSALTKSKALCNCPANSTPLEVVYAFNISDRTRELFAEMRKHTRNFAKREDVWRSRLTKQWHALGANEITRHVRGGIPGCYRAFAWPLMTEAQRRRKANPGVFEALLRKRSPHHAQIGKDVPRTFPELEFFGIGQEGHKALFRVLTAYSLYDPAVGYCQGMAFVAAVLLLNAYDAEDAFWMLERVFWSDKYKLRHLFSKGFPLLFQCFFVLNELVRERRPALHRHMMRQRCTVDIFATKWFMTLWTRDVPLECVLRIWDVFLNEGMRVFFTLPLSILKFKEAELMATDFQGMVMNLASIEKDGVMQDAGRVVRLATEVSLSDKKLQKKCQLYADELYRHGRESFAPRNTGGGGRSPGAAMKSTSMASLVKRLSATV